MSGDGKRGGAQASVLAPILDSTKWTEVVRPLSGNPTQRPLAKYEVSLAMCTSRAFSGQVGADSLSWATYPALCRVLDYAEWKRWSWRRGCGR